MTQDHRARQYAATHQRIYDTAMELFRETGYEDVPISRLAAAAGVSVQTFYAHYPSKDDLIMAPPDRGQVTALLATVPADLPLGERLRRVLRHFLHGLEGERRSDALARWQLIAAVPRLRYRAAEYERATAQMCLDALGNGEQQDPASTIVVTAHLSAYTLALLRWGESGGELSLEDVLEQAMSALREL